LANEEELKIIIEAFAESAVRELEKVNRALQEQSALAKEQAAAQKQVAKIVATVTTIYMTAWQVLQKIIRETIEAEAVQVKLETAYKNSANTFGYTIDELNKMAECLSVTSTFSDEAIKSAQTMMLTFNRLSHETFPQLLQAAMDYASFSGRDLVGVTKQFGMALEDPIRGMNRLRMAGVTFSAQQQQMIRDFVKNNDVASAQGIIMEKLSSQWSGQAAAAAKTLGGQLSILQNNINELFESPTTGKWLKAIVNWVNELVLSVDIAVGKIQEWNSRLNLMFLKLDINFAKFSITKSDSKLHDESTYP
jgi:hypothetical protein